MAQKWMVFAFDETDGTPVTAITLSNLTGKISKDGADAVALSTAAADNELEAGYYTFTLTEAETDADQLTIIGACSTPANTQVVGSPATEHTFNHVVSGGCTTGGTTATVETTLDATAPAGHGLTTASALIGRVLIFDADTTTTALRQQSGVITAQDAAGKLTFATSTFTVEHAAADTFKIY